jgi:arabinofuranosyltransferase
VLALLPDLPAGTPVPLSNLSQDGARFRRSEERLAQYGLAGFFGYFAGPGKHVIDKWALCDPLLSRIPYRTDGRIRIGHYQRPIPDGYLRARLEGPAELKDPGLRAAYSDIVLAVRAPLFSLERFRAIARLNFGVHRAAFARVK